MSKSLERTPGKFYRKAEIIERSGYGYTQFHEALKKGDFPPADAYLGPRSPVWTDATYCEWQRRKLAQPKQPPIQTPRRRTESV
jgi:predicted DNA-binding transcriptional regulator AlpA